ncbi:LAG1 homologue 2 [Prunus dulcis]|uniref:LAG1 homologue 2 n=1 Tax=Prunus dulcis TaxID=3755 RepID=A0A4Y1RYS0_PRUDU|nr:LAG1 homologue 2 [Prunus dulcis]
MESCGSIKGQGGAAAPPLPENHIERLEFAPLMRRYARKKMREEEDARGRRCTRKKMCAPFKFCPFSKNFLGPPVMKIAIWLLSKGSAPLKLDMATRAKVVKCSESLWKLAYYATVEACILKISYQEPWFRDTKEYFKGWPNQELGLPLKLLYMGQCGFYTYSIVALLTWETRRKDFSVMMGHHVITVLLIGFSYITSFFRIGSIILALHDASDVFLEAAKVFKYSEKELAANSEDDD